MIASVRGLVAALGPDGAVVEVGGVGLAVSCSPGTLARLRVGETARLATSLVVREDSLTLYGFADDDERALFELLQTANGVGPKLAQTMLAVHPPREVRRAIATSDLAALTKVPGIGRKGAERIVLELRDRIGSIDGSDQSVSAGAAVSPPWRRGATSSTHALAGLGFSGGEAGEAIEVVAGDVADGESPNVSALLRRSIQLLGRADDDRPDRGSRRSPNLAPDERDVEASLRPKRLGEFVGQPKVREQLQLVLESRTAPQPPARPRAAVRAARARQDQPGDDHRRRTRRADPGHQRAGDRAGRRPRRAAHQPRRRRGAVHRRDPPHRPAGRGTALHGDGGLPGRRHGRQGTGRHRDPARPRAVHPGRRHHPRRAAHRPAA